MIDALQDFTASLPTVLQWVGVILAAAIPFIESYFGSVIGILAGMLESSRSRIAEELRSGAVVLDVGVSCATGPLALGALVALVLVVVAVTACVIVQVPPGTRLATVGRATVLLP